MCVRETSNKYYMLWMCVCSLRYSAWACATLSSVACPAVQFFPRYLINGFFLEREIYWTQNVFLFLQILSETFTILKKTSEKYNKKMYIGLQVQTCENLIKLEFSKQIFENNKIWGSQKFVQWEKEVFHADGRTNGMTDMTKLSFSSVLRTHLKLKWPYYQPQVNLRFYRNLR
jgi:hypothetical protein